MPEARYIGSAVGKTNSGTSIKTVYVKVPKLRFFMEPRVLSFAPAESFSPSVIAAPKPLPTPKDTLGTLSQVKIPPPNPLTLLLMGLFY